MKLNRTCSGSHWCPNLLPLQLPNDRQTEGDSGKQRWNLHRATLLIQSIKIVVKMSVPLSFTFYGGLDVT